MAKYLMFFGAGASKPFGIPTMEEFPDKLQFTDEDAKLLRDVKETLRNFGIRTDLESIFTSLNEYDSALDPTFLSPALAIRLGNALYDKVEERFGAERSGSYARLRQSIQNQIAKLCSPFGIGEQVYYTFRSFLGALVPSNATEVAALANLLASNQVDFFTTNYDIVIETFINLARSRFPQLNQWRVEDGTTASDPKHWDPYNYNQGVTMCVPLHGSIELHTTKSGVVKGQGKGDFYGEELTGDLLIYPVRGKYIYQDPFAKLYSLFRQDLEIASFAIFVGFSFSDEAIRDTLISAIRRRLKLSRAQPQQMLKVVIYSPHATDVIQKKLAPYLEGTSGWNHYIKGENWEFEDTEGHRSLRSLLQGSWQS